MREREREREKKLPMRNLLKTEDQNSFITSFSHPDLDHRRGNIGFHRRVNPSGSTSSGVRGTTTLHRTTLADCKYYIWDPGLHYLRNDDMHPSVSAIRPAGELLRAEGDHGKSNPDI